MVWRNCVNWRLFHFPISLTSRGYKTVAGECKRAHFENAVFFNTPWGSFLPNTQYAYLQTNAQCKSTFRKVTAYEMLIIFEILFNIDDTDRKCFHRITQLNKLVNGKSNGTCCTRERYSDHLTEWCSSRGGTVTNTVSSYTENDGMVHLSAGNKTVSY